ncbi:GyrI-like domain-containing protein [Amycolatopsis sp. YIM 10]|uniref:GyrI-like domain-containing protein n=1 Tax=Amycolatopsis sp. YIM 10 TaxID=2653857 RepID=UPI001290731E|nr:GyrI-like domain-containing protein [Amycolatopsis sp. YIM 10]QFU89473.1 hypothetical protein YIM_21470 [Amycolatopsis sp. YIM 10]
MTDSVLNGSPDRIRREDVAVMERTGRDELSEMQALWAGFEDLVGLRGRKMYARADEREGTYTVCTPVKPEDDPAGLGLRVGTLPGGWYLRGRLVGEPPGLYGRIAPGFDELMAVAEPDEARPLVEFYRRYDQVELWLPIRE